jgi:hypothetical protein
MVIVRTPSTGSPADVVAAVQHLRSHNARPGLHLVDDVPGDAAAVLQVDADTFVFEPSSRATDRLAYDLKRALALVRGRRPAAQLVVAIDAAEATALRARGLDAYVDRFSAPSAPLASPDALLESRGADGPIWHLLDDPVAASGILAQVAALQAWFPEGLAPMPARALTCGDSRLPTFMNPRTLDLVAVTRSCAAPATVTSDIPGVTAERIDVGRTSAFRVHGERGDRFAEGVDVAGRRTLTVEEIVARHQAAAARQASEIQTDIARGSFTLTFEAPGFVAPVTITSKLTIYRDGSTTDLRQSQITVNGAPFPTTGGVPKLPIIEPERVASPPLAIALTDVYRYRLMDRAVVEGRPAYVVEFGPRLRQGARAATPGSLYEGRAWIDTRTFGMMRVSAVQTGLKGPITASEQTDEFRLDDAGHWLLARSDTRQTYEGASIRTPIHRLMVIDNHAINSPDFAAERAAAYASHDVMLRDTSSGFRYLAPPATADRHAEAGSRQPAIGDRQLIRRVEQIRTVVFGVIVDPNISMPLPFAGLSYVNFNLFGTGTQLNAFYGGTFGQLAFSVPSVGGTRWQVAGRAFAIASSYNDRAFEHGLEQYPLDILQRPASAAVWVLRPLTPRTEFRVEYDWEYTRFARGDLTSPAFIVPRNQNAHGIRAGFDFQHVGWQASVWASAAHRIGWRAWGLASDLSDVRGSYQRAGASLLRSVAFSPRLTTRIEAAVMGGSNLDRFSRFAFGAFDNRLHGYPSALVRYDRGAVARGAVAWAPGRAVRLDGFLDTAGVHDPGFGPGIRNYTGFGAAVEAPAPFGTLVAVEWGFGIRGVNTNGRIGTHVVRISGYKVF